MRSLPAALLAVTALAGPALAQAQDEPSPKGDLARLQGTWEGKVGPNKDIPMTVIFAGRTFTASGTNPESGEAFAVTGEIRIDEKADPKTWDWIKAVGPGGQKIPDNLALYTLERDTLTLCLGGPGNPRPSEFKAVEGSPSGIVTFHRVKDDPTRSRDREESK